jgi:cation:H+ antiporter
MTGGVVAILGLVGGVVLAFAGAGALRRGSRAFFSGAAGGLAVVACFALPEFAFTLRASVENLPGAAVGVVAGSLTANAFLAAVIAATGTQTQVKGARAFAIASAAAAAVLIAVAYDGVITKTEGGMMLLGAVAVVWQLVGAKAQFVATDKPAESPSASARLLALAWAAAGVAFLLAGTWLALRGTQTLSVGRPDGDLMIGLTALGFGAALPETVSAILAARRGDGGRAFLNLSAGVSLMLLGALGAAALVRPIAVSESFLHAPTAAVAASALVLLLIALSKGPAPRLAVGAGVLVYGGFLAAFLGAFG